MQKLQSYIEENFEGNQANFGRSLIPPVARQQVYLWIQKGYLVHGHRLYSPRRELITGIKQRVCE